MNKEQDPQKLKKVCNALLDLLEYDEPQLLKSLDEKKALLHQNCLQVKTAQQKTPLLLFYTVAISKDLGKF